MVNFVLNPYLLAAPAYFPGKTVTEYQEQYGFESILDMASNVNPLGPSPKAIHAIQQAGQQIHHYPGADLCDLRIKLAKHIDPNLGEGNIIVGNGSCDILRMAAEVFLYGGGEVIMRRNDFPMFEVGTRRYGGECVFVKTNPDYSFNVLSVVDKINVHTKLIFLSNPHNPTGTIIPQDDLDKLMDKIPSSIVVVFDHACEEYVEGQNFPDIPRYILDGRNIIMTRTFSKMHALPGLRIGYGVARKEIIEILGRTQIPFYNNTVSILAASAALDDIEHTKLSNTINQEGKEFLYEKFEKLSLSYVPTQSSFILLVDFKHDTEVIRQAMLRQGILAQPAHPYHFPNAIRITIGRQEDNLRLVSALKHVLEELNSEKI